MYKTILGIETSCDETAAAVLQKGGDKIKILSNIVSSSALLQTKYGGIIPEQAAREQLKVIIPVVKEALEQANLKREGIDAIAVTYGPGLIGSLLVGVETAKTLALVWDEQSSGILKPLIPVNHLLGHFYANWIENPTPPSFPLLGLLVSGGHTDLVLFKDHMDYEYLGGTRDDAAGECFDKCARLLGLPYPGGPEISKLGENGDPKLFNLPKPMMASGDYDFSFSGLKTAVANLSSQLNLENPQVKRDLCASIEETITETLIRKTLKAAKQFNVGQIMLAGGVAANQKLKTKLQEAVTKLNPDIELYIPPPHLCTDNGAMIAAAAFFSKKIIHPLELQADPSLGL